jgi:hypothetical protein
LSISIQDLLQKDFSRAVCFSSWFSGFCITGRIGQPFNRDKPEMRRRGLILKEKIVKFP